MVHFPTLPSPSYEFRGRYSGINQSGFPHSEIPGSKPACGSPGLIAACHVLHRLLAPRHSPYALSSLTKIFTYTLRVCGQKTTDCGVFSCQRSCNLEIRDFEIWRFGVDLVKELFGDYPISKFSPSRQIAKSPHSVVENTGLEPVTSWLQTRRSPS
jgi:hypothetical protein